MLSEKYLWIDATENSQIFLKNHQRISIEGTLEVLTWSSDNLLLRREKDTR
jgi:hypothetical protein